jgi:hypothetical protein
MAAVAPSIEDGDMLKTSRNRETENTGIVGRNARAQGP